MLALVLMGGGELFAFVAVIQPYQQHVQATASSYALATASALQDTSIQATSGNPTLNDALNGRNGNNWDVVNNSGEGSCSFKDNAYHATVLQADYLYACFASALNFSNFAYHTQMTILQGDYGGIIFRANGANSKYYYFRVGKDGAFDLSYQSGQIGVFGGDFESKSAEVAFTNVKVWKI